jgi:hypothetical protein
MGLGNRHAHQHETVGVQKNAVIAAEFADFAVHQAVQTCDGYPGVVTAVLDGPHPGTEAYEVTLDNGMGGGLYSTGQLTPLVGTTAERHTGGELHTADADYPELRDILVQRPDIA